MTFNDVDEIIPFQNTIQNYYEPNQIEPIQSSINSTNRHENITPIIADGNKFSNLKNIDKKVWKRSHGRSEKGSKSCF